MRSFPASTESTEVFNTVKDWLDRNGFRIVREDQSRPWGGFFVIDETQAFRFIDFFFSQLSLDRFAQDVKLSPKILIVAPEKRLSWQYHHRRSEIWKVIGGNAKIVVSDSDELQSPRILNSGATIRIGQGERHRLIGTGEYGIIAEIWQHTDINNPSDEEDIVRVQDDFGR